MEEYHLYNGEIVLTADFAGKKHEYRVNGKVVDGVTTILGILNKPMLIGWAAKEAVKDIGYYERDSWDDKIKRYVPAPLEEQEKGLQRCISIHERIKTMDIDEYWLALHNAKGASNRKKTEAADIGTLVHTFVEDYIKGKNPSVPDLPKVREGAEAFMKWVNANDIKFTLSEKKVWSKKYKVAGTLDWAGYVNGVPTMGDTKTSNFFNPEMFWQVSAYQHARQEEYPEEQYEQQMIVRVGKDGTLEVFTSRDYKKNIKAFAACQTVFDRQRETKIKNEILRANQ